MNLKRSDRRVMVALLGAMALFAVVVVLISAPAAELRGTGDYDLRSAFHGVLAGILMVMLTIGLYAAFQLWTGIQVQIRELSLGSLISSALCFLTLVSGNWLLIPYNAEEGPKRLFLNVSPAVDLVFFKFKTLTALFTFPLIVAAAYIIWLYKDKLNASESLRTSVAVALVLAFFYFVVTFGLGAAVTKLMPV